MEFDASYENGAAKTTAVAAATTAMLPLCLRHPENGASGLGPQAAVSATKQEKPCRGGSCSALERVWGVQSRAKP